MGRRGLDRGGGKIGWGSRGRVLGRYYVFDKKNNKNDLFAVEERGDGVGLPDRGRFFNNFRPMHLEDRKERFLFE